MTGTQEQPDGYPKAYENDYQKWIAESKLALICIVLWEVGAASSLVFHLLRANLLFTAGSVLWLLVALLVHFWREELAPEMRHTGGESSE